MASLTAWPTDLRSSGSSRPSCFLNALSDPFLPRISRSASASASSVGAPSIRVRASAAMRSISSIMVWKPCPTGLSPSAKQAASAVGLLEGVGGEREAERRAARRPSTCAVSSPPWASTRPRLIHRPRPVPVGRPWSRRKNLVNTFGRSSAGMPSPVSATETATSSPHDRAGDLHADRARVLGRVLDQVGEHLLDLVGVGVDLGQVVGRPGEHSRSG